MSLLAAHGVTKRFGGVTALDGVELEAQPGRTLGLLGANGSGKSTLSKIIAGEIRPDAGRIVLGGQEVRLASPQDAAARGIVIAHQHPNLAPDLLVWENLFLGAEHCGPAGFVNRRASRRAARALLEELGAPIDVEQPAGMLSAAGQQMVEIARALSRKPRLLILDEPTAALATAEVARLFAAVRRLTGSGVGVIFISHRLQEVEDVCDAILVLRNGRDVGRWDTSGRLDERRILELMTGDPEAVLRLPARREIGEPVLRLQELRAGKVRGANLEIRHGEIVGLAGLQGQGQEELLEVVAGFRHLEGGAIRHRGEDVWPRLPRDMIGRGICFVPNDRQRQGLFMDGSVGENLGYVRLSLDRRPWRLPRAELRAFAERAIRRLLIRTEGPGQAVATLSGGNQQKVVIGKWLAAGIDVLLLSDPTKGVDVHARSEIYATLGELAAQGSAILVFASDVQELLAHCDRILVMYEGRIVDELAGNAMSEQRVMAAAFGTAA